MALRIDIVTLFPEMFEGFCAAGIVGRAIRGGLVEIHRTNIRRFATDSYGTVDDAPFGGGPGMVLTCPPVFAAVEFVQKQAEAPGEVILLTPQGKPMSQDLARQLADQERLILLAGHYEGFDERIRAHLAEMEISLGDFVLSGGEVAAMAVCDAVIRLLPGALGKDESVVEESFSTGLLEYPQYTRPIARWRRQQAESRTRQRRPGLWEAYRRNSKNSGQE